MAMGLGALRFAAWLAGLSALAACGDGEQAAPTGSASGGKPAPSGSVARQAPSTAPTSSAASFDAKAFCDRLCKRSAACGLERAESLAKSGEPSDLAALEKARADQPTVEKTCAEACAKAPPSGAADDAVAPTEACLAEKECTAFRACIAKLPAKSSP
ncbi:MAG: hypothetical protein IPM79_33515 [Polyangiaceae bacterium]|jgi:hypothetical protein|nr:hypothetical protein [Polyangiaceae bacterium]